MGSDSDLDEIEGLPSYLNNGWIILLEYVVVFISLSLIAEYLYRRHVFIAIIVMILVTIGIFPFYFIDFGNPHSAFFFAKAALCDLLFFFTFIRIAYYTKDRIEKEIKPKYCHCCSVYIDCIWKCSRKIWCISDFNDNNKSHINKIFTISWYLLFIVNIFVAVLQDLLVTNYYFNALSGLLLIIIMPIPQRFCCKYCNCYNYDKTEMYDIDFNHLHHKQIDNYNDIILKFDSFAYPFIYSLWNTCFIAGNSFDEWYRTTFHLWLPIILCIIFGKKDQKFFLWFQHRSILLWCIIIAVTINGWDDYFLDSSLLIKNIFGEPDSSLGNETYKLFINIFGAFNCFLTTIYVIYWFRFIYYKKKLLQIQNNAMPLQEDQEYKESEELL